MAYKRPYRLIMIYLYRYAVIHFMHFTFDSRDVIIKP